MVDELILEMLRIRAFLETAVVLVRLSQRILCATKWGPGKYFHVLPCTNGKLYLTSGRLVHPLTASEPHPF